MARYDLRSKPSVAKDLRRIPRSDVERLLARIEALRDDPRPPGAAKLAGRDGYRLRQGDYRILYTVADDEGVIEVLKVAHRRDVYREP